MMAKARGFQWLLLPAWASLVVCGISAFGAPAAGPLRVHPTNPRYFTDGTKTSDGSWRAVYLTGSHTWGNLCDYLKKWPPFDFPAYLDFLERYNHNFIRLWSGGGVGHAPTPYVRTGPGIATDGGKKVDLEQFDQVFFDRLRARVIAARDRGVYVGIMLFSSDGAKREDWSDLLYHPANNVQGINADTNGDGSGAEAYDLSIPRITAFQEAFVRKVIETVNDLDNVLYEIGNEGDETSIPWQYHFIRFIKKCQATNPKQHPVGMTAVFGILKGNWASDNRPLFESPADWISPGLDPYKDDPPAADGKKVIIADVDHIWPAAPHSGWVWKCFVRGIQPILMDSYTYDDPTWTTVAEQEAMRKSMGQTLTWANRMNLAAMTPRNDLASTGYCLADEGRSYVIYAPKMEEISVNGLQVGRQYRGEWFNTGKGTVEAPLSITASDATIRLRPPYDAAALFLTAESTALPVDLIETAFENGSPLWYEADPTGVLQVFLNYDHERRSPNRASGHIHFRVDAPTGTKFTLEFRNLHNIYNGRPGSVAGELKALVISEDGRHWRSIATRHLPENRVLLDLEMPGPKLFVARVEPYRLSDLDALLASIRGQPQVQITEIGKTVEGRPLEIIRLGDPAAPHRVFLRARAHPWEAGTNWVVQGLIRRLLKGDADAKGFLRSYCVQIMPMANKDGVARGRSRFNSNGKDLNREWNKPADPQLAPENHALEQWLEQMTAAGQKPHLALELHNDSNGKLHISRPPVADLERHLKRMAALEALLRKHTWFVEGTTGATFRNIGTLGDGWFERFGIDAVVHEFNCQWSAGLGRPPLGRDWETYGEGLARVFKEYFALGGP